MAPVDAAVAASYVWKMLLSRRAALRKDLGPFAPALFPQRHVQFIEVEE